VAVWRTAPAGAVSFADVLRAQFSAEAVEMLTFTGPFLCRFAERRSTVSRGLTAQGTSRLGSVAPGKRFKQMGTFADRRFRELVIRQT
jgi:hypothetical protein